jgi:hypothetical protein
VRLAFFISIEIHVVIYFLWLKDHLNAEISREIEFVYRKLVIGFRSIQKSMHRFEEDEHNLKDEPDPMVLAQLNMLTQFVRYWPIIHIFYKMDCLHSEYSPEYNQMWFGWRSLAPESLFQMDSSSARRWSKVGKGSTLNGAPGVPRVKIRISACKNIYNGQNMDSLQ